MQSQTVIRGNIQIVLDEHKRRIEVHKAGGAHDAYLQRWSGDCYGQDSSCNDSCTQQRVINGERNDQRNADLVLTCTERSRSSAAEIRLNRWGRMGDAVAAATLAEVRAKTTAEFVLET